MFICSITLTKERIAFLLAVFLVVLLVLGTGISYFSAERYLSHSARRRFLEQYGYETEATPFSKETLTLPRQGDEWYLQYEALQNQQGLTLSPYFGKTVKKYTYRITNYPDTAATVYANLFLYRGRIIACDLLCPDVKNGFLEPLIPQNTAPQTSQ